MVRITFFFYLCDIMLTASELSPHTAAHKLPGHHSLVTASFDHQHSGALQITPWRGRRGGRNIMKDLLSLATGKAKTTVAGGLQHVIDDISSVAGKVKKSTEDIVHLGTSLLGGSAKLTLKVGKALILPPIKGVERSINLAYGIKELGADLTKLVLSETKGLIGKSWQMVKSVDYPGKKSLVLLFPTGLICVVDYARRTTWHLLNLTGKLVKAAEAWALYAAVDLVSMTLSQAIHELGLNCVKLKPMTLTIDNPVVDELQTGHGRMCGWAHLFAVNNVTITKDSTRFLVVNVPYTLRKLSVTFDSLTAYALGEKVIDHEVVHVTIEKVRAHGTVSFRAGTILRFVSIHIAVDDMEGFFIDFPKQKHKTLIMNMVEGMGDLVGEAVTDTINRKFAQFENQISNFIQG